MHAPFHNHFLSDSLAKFCFKRQIHYIFAQYLHFYTEMMSQNVQTTAMKLHTYIHTYFIEPPQRGFSGTIIITS